jgi:hypothetical protein
MNALLDRSLLSAEAKTRYRAIVADRLRAMQD